MTTLGVHWWVDGFVMLKPVNRMLKMSLMKNGTAHSNFTVLSLYDAEQVSQDSFRKFCKRIGIVIAKWPTSRKS